MGRNKIGAYYRLSMEDDDGKEESNSIANQRLLIRRYVSEHKELSDYEYSEFYDDGYRPWRGRESRHYWKKSGKMR